MTQPTTLELAKKGNPEAIKALINQSLESKGITVKIAIKNNCLMVMAESETPADKLFLVNFIRQGLKHLNLESINRVILQAHSIGNKTPEWRTGFDLNPENAENKDKLPTNEDKLNQKSSPNKKKGNQNKKASTKPPHPLVIALRFLLGILLYFVAVAVFIAIAFGIKLAAILVAESVLYNIQLMGDALRGMQIIELLNLLVFAIFGMGISSATVLLPRYFAVNISKMIAIICVPIIASTSDIVKYNNWLNEVADTEKITYPQAQNLTNSFLQNRVGNSGFLGFYIYTADYPVLPLKKIDMNNNTNPKLRVAARFASFTKMKTEQIMLLFSLSGWGLRIFYFLVAVMTTIAHFRQGLEVAKRASQPPKPLKKTPKPPNR